MTAIQRWVIFKDGRELFAEPLDAIEDLWCKAKDVAELERVIAEQSKTHQAVVEGLRRQLARVKHMVPADTFETQEDDGPHAMWDSELVPLKARIEFLERTALGMQQDHKAALMELAQLRTAHSHLQDRYDLLMQRVKEAKIRYPH